MEETKEPIDEGPDEERIVCTVCLHANDSRAQYCARCGGVINSLLGFAPYDRILLEGFAYRRAVDGPPSKIILAGIWLLFGPSILLLPILFSDLRITNESTGRTGLVVEHAYWAIHLLVSIVIIYRTTANYLAKRKIGRENAGL